jgi:UDP-N-acetylmuramoyl-tripeptide--D-alanyl-D-alanine ligase
MPFNKDFIQAALSGVSIISGKCPRECEFSIDSRTLQAGNIFVAISGAKVDGHDYIYDVLRKNAAGIVIAESKKYLIDACDKTLLKDVLIIVVPSPMQALIQLAAVWRKQFTFPVVAITGSVGKTSTKEMLAGILKLHGDTYLASQGNQNTLIGVALNILRIRSHHTVALFEVGISKRGEMAAIAQLLQPTYGLITSIGHSHMEGLGSLADIALEKRAIFSCFTERSIGIINGDQSVLAAVSYPHPVVKFGLKTTNQVQARKMRIVGAHIHFVLKIYDKKYTIVLKHAHAGFVINALACATAAHLLGVSPDTIVQGIETPAVVTQRFQLRAMKHNKGTLIDDCYNANPESMKAAILAFQALETNLPKIAVLGDMLELGVNSPFWHRQLGRFLRKAPSIERVILVGEMVKWTKKTAPAGLAIELVGSWQEAIEKLENEGMRQVTVLLKASNGMRFKNIVERFVAP